MTAEVVVCNRVAVALAADSALTVSVVTEQDDGTHVESRKIFSDADKIFELIRGRPVGVMLYDTSSLLSVPWETIVKWYRSDRAGRSFPELRDYVQDFIKFIEERASSLFSEVSVSEFCQELVARIAHEWIDAVCQVVDVEDDDSPSVEEILQHALVRAAEDLPEENLGWTRELEPEDLLDEYGEEHLLDAIPLAVGGTSLSRKCREALRDWALREILTSRSFGNQSSVVVAGFGEEDVYPSIYVLDIAGVLVGRLMVLSIRERKVSSEKPAFIQTFAQTDDADAFIFGIDRWVKSTIEEYWQTWLKSIPKNAIRITEGEIGKLTREQRRKILRQLRDYGNRAWSQFAETMNSLQRERLVDPLEQSAAFLSKAELARLAENLVDISAIRARITLDREETVGSETDVAVISRGEGLIWIKRKHYFPPNLNLTWASREARTAVHLGSANYVSKGAKHD